VSNVATSVGNPLIKVVSIPRRFVAPEHIPVKPVPTEKEKVKA